MDSGRMKNMVVLKDLPSNIIDEAIVVLKPNIKVGAGLRTRPDNQKSTTDDKIGTADYIINEAQMVISNYISNIENAKKMKYENVKRIESRYKILRAVVIAVTVLGLLNYFIKLI